MPSLLTARPKTVITPRDNDSPRIALKRDNRSTTVLPAPTYVTPSHELPRASQIDSFDLSASGSSTLSSSQSRWKRPPASPQKAKEPAKRRNVNEIEDSDEEFGVDEDVDAVMTTLSNPDDDHDHFAIKMRPEDQEQMEESHYGKSKADDMIPNSPPAHEEPTNILSCDIETNLNHRLQSSSKLIREDTPSFSDEVHPIVQMNASPPARPVLADLELRRHNLGVSPLQCVDQPQAFEMNSGKTPDELVAALKKEHMQLKADMTEIVEDENRGMHCDEAKENKRRRDEIQAQLTSLTSDSRVAVRKQLEMLKQKIFADMVIGVVPTEDTTREVQTLTEKLKFLENIPRPSSVASSTSRPSPTVSHLPSGRLNEHNQLGPDRTISPHTNALRYPTVKPATKTLRDISGSSSPFVDQSRMTSNSTVPRVRRLSGIATSSTERQLQTSAVASADNVIELISDDDEGTEYEMTTNMGHAVDFGEDDFSDGLDYVENYDIEAQRARYEELTQQPRNHANKEPGRQVIQSSSRRSLMPNDGHKGPLDSYMRPSPEQLADASQRADPLNKVKGTQATVISASPTQHTPASRPPATQRIASTQAPTRVARPTARPVDLMSLPGMNHPWSKDVVRAMNEVFQLRYFRANQLEAINATLSGKDAFVLMPTGGGKSLCYQLPSIIRTGTTRGVTVVVSPLVSLMQDQVDHLEAINIRATSFNSDKTVAERSNIMRQLVNQEIDCIYIAPEMLTKSDSINKVFKELWQKESLARIVIDEAHCVSQWGHDFRPDYKKLGEFRQEYKGVPVIALTATANDKVQVDVKNHLGLENPACFKQSFNRPNLHYYVYTRSKGSADKIKDLLDKTHKGQTGIIYCLSRAKCEALANELGDRTAFYHAGMEKHERANVQRLWQAGRYRVIVATIAFGMGIDKSDVRFVIHMSLPKSLEGYYQETGRAGRDGRESICYLFWSFQDKTSLERMIDRGETDGQKISPAQKKVQKEAIQHVVDYADNKADCRRAQVLRFFNEPFDVKDCHQTCDNCQSSEVYTDQDVTEAAKIAVKIARGVVEAGDTERDRRATLADLVSIARGSKQARITDRCWDRLDGFGALKSEARWDITNTNKLFQHLVAIGVLQDNHVPNAMGFTTTYCVPGPKANAAICDKLSVSLKIQSPRGKKPVVPRTNSRQSRDPDMDDFIVEDDVEDDGFIAPKTNRAPAPSWPKDLNQFRHKSDHTLPAKKSSGTSTIGTSEQKQRRTRDSYGEMMEKMYKRSFTPLDLDRITRCWAELKQKRNEIQLKQRHQRTDSTFSDQLLQDIAVHLPITQTELVAMPDMRKDVADSYGFEILCITNKFQEEIDGAGIIDVDAQKDLVSRATSDVPMDNKKARETSRRASTNTPNYREPYFQEREDDESDYFNDLDDEQPPEISPNFQNEDSGLVRSATNDKSKRRLIPQKNGTMRNSKPRTNVQSQSRAKASNGSKKSSGAMSIGVAKSRQ